MSNITEQALRRQTDIVELTQFITLVTEVNAVRGSHDDEPLPEFFAPVPVTGTITAIR